MLSLGIQLTKSECSNILEKYEQRRSPNHYYECKIISKHKVTGASKYFSNIYFSEQWPTHGENIANSLTNFNHDYYHTNTNFHNNTINQRNDELNRSSDEITDLPERMKEWEQRRRDGDWKGRCWGLPELWRSRHHHRHCDVERESEWLGGGDGLSSSLFSIQILDRCQPGVCCILDRCQPGVCSTISENVVSKPSPSDLFCVQGISVIQIFCN